MLKEVKRRRNSFLISLTVKLNLHRTVDGYQALNLIIKASSFVSRCNYFFFFLLMLFPPFQQSQPCTIITTR